MLNILWRNMKWRLQNPISIAVTILQPLLWLVLYGPVAGRALPDMGTGNYTTFILPGIMVLVTFAACSSGGMINYLLKASGSFYRVLIAPVSRNSIVLGQMLEAVLVSLLETGILCLVAGFFAVRIASGPVGLAFLVFLIFLTALSLSALAYAVSLLLPNAVIYETVMTAIVLPLFFLSSALFPTVNLSGGLAATVRLNPLTPIINALRSLILGETILFGDILPVLVLLLVMCCGSFALAKWRLHKETDR